MQRPTPDHPTLTGWHDGHFVQLRPIVDTLSTRKLPIFWLQVTMPVPLDVEATFDFMMRPNGPSTFSNFEYLPHTAPTPHGLPQDGLLRTDDPDRLPAAGLIAPAFGLFSDPRVKELLVSPKGVRIVVQLAQAARAQYGVFRQAEFGDVQIDAAGLDEILAAMQGVVAGLNQRLDA